MVFDKLKPNHLLGYRRTFLRLVFRNVGDLLSVRKVLLPVATTNKEKLDALDTYAEVVNASLAGMDLESEAAASSRKNISDALDYVVDIREYDVPYYLRVAIDKGKRLLLTAWFYRWS